MYIQPNDNALRKHIPIADYYRQLEAQKKRSLIGQTLNIEQIDIIQERIDELEALEQSGFVFLGEKSWLTDFLSASGFHNYTDWVAHHFQNHLKLDFYISDEYDYLEETIWCANFNTDGFRLGYPELKNPSFLEMDELEILVAGDEHGPSPSLLVKAFEIMHSLEYAISTIDYQSKGGELSITGIMLTNFEKPDQWELNVVSTYGSAWDISMVGGQHGKG